MPIIKPPKSKLKKKALETNPHGAIITSLFNNPAMPVPGDKGKRKYGRLTYAELRNLSVSNEIIRICINKIKSEVSKTPSIFRAKDSLKAESLKPQLEFLNSLYEHPNQAGDSWRDIIVKLVEDILVLDMGVLEKVKNLKGEVLEIYQVDGGTIVVNTDKFGLFKDPAYYQYLGYSTQPDAEFELDDLLIFQVNPQGTVGKVGYGSSPVEAIAMTALTSLQTAMYNQTFFDQNTLPPNMINLPGISNDALVGFREQFVSTLQGKPWSTVFTNSPTSIDVKPLRPTNMEMQFMELTKWLTHLILSVFGLNPVDLGMVEDVNRSNSEVQQELSRTQGIANILDVIAQEINRDLVGDLAMYDPKFKDIEFAWVIEEKTDPYVQAQVDQIRIQNGIVTPNEIRARDGLKPLVEPAIIPGQQYNEDEDPTKDKEGEDPSKGKKEEVKKSIYDAIYDSYMQQ